MLQIKNKSGKNACYFPKNIAESGDTHTITFYNDFGGDTKTIQCKDYKALKDYYCFYLDLSEFDDGEYIYTIDDITKGLIIIGDITPKESDYDTQTVNTNNIVQYEG